MKDSTKRNTTNALVAVLLLGIGLVWGYILFGTQYRDVPLETIPTDTLLVEEVDSNAVVTYTLDDHIAMIVPEKLQGVCKALIFVESRGKASAVSPDGGYVGILQLGRLYVKECNRIQDSIVFTPEDRFDSIKSLQMFTIFQTKHNPTHDVDRAIHLHNPTAGPSYRNKVKQKLNTIY